MDNLIFRKDVKDYSKTIQPINDYIDQMSFYVSKLKSIPIQDAKTIVRAIIKNHPVHIPKVKYQHKNEVGDIVEDETNLLNYIQDAKKNNEIIVPSFTTYTHPKVKKSLHSEFIAVNVKKRSYHKKLAFKAKQEKDDVTYAFNNVLQKTMKIFNNSLSGAYGDKSTVVFNPSSHYTLTSITRCVASIGNAITESVVAGNKHFRNPEIVYGYINAILSKLNKSNIDLVVKTFNLYVPSVQDLMDKLIIPNIDPYWRDPQVESDLLTYLSKCDDQERVALLYTNDLWTMKDCNQGLIRNLLTDMSKQVTGVTDDVKYLTEYGDAIEILSKIINANLIKGISVDYEKLKGTETLYALASTAKNIMDVLNKYKLLFKVFLVTDILPISISYIKEMLRSVIILSDTDSTCGAYDQWVKWYYHGKVIFSDEATAIAASVMTINSQLVDHGLKILAYNMNMDTDSVELIKMKNEFFWPVFTVANVNKHYYAATAIQEGNVFDKMDLELKGVHFIASNADREVVKAIHSMLVEVNETVSSNKKINLYSFIKRVADLERSIIDRVKSGDVTVFKKDKIKSKEAYKAVLEQSPYFHHLLWTDVFAQSYGQVQEPPYDVIKIPTTLNSKKKLDSWLYSQDESFRNRMVEFLTRYNKNSLGTIRPPISIVSSSGIPTELLSVIDLTRIVEDNMLSAYYFLETLGIYKKEGLLISEMGY